MTEEKESDRQEQEEQRCGNCRFVERMPRNLEVGHCRAGPPGVYLAIVARSLERPKPQIMSSYPPVTLADKGCGCHKFNKESIR